MCAGISNESLLAIIGVAGTLLGVIISSTFTYLTKRSEHALFVKRLRAEKLFELYDSLLFRIVQGEATDFFDVNGQKRPIVIILTSPDSFEQWYIPFTATWFQKRHLFDDQSLDAVRAVHNFLLPVVGRAGSVRDSIGSLSREDAFQLSEQLLPLLSHSYQVLREYLFHGLEKN